MHPALLILLSCLLTQVIAWLGKDRIFEVVYTVYNHVFNRKMTSRQKALRKEIFQLKQELGMTSSQDEFAKWAKLRRRVDKGLADLEGVNKQLGSARSSVSMIFKAFMFVLSTGVPFIITTYHRKSPIFYLPPGDWLGPLSSLLAMPSAPAGAVSATVWSMACKRVIALFEARFKDAFGASVPAKDGSAAAKEAAEGVEMKFAKDAKKEGTEGVKPSSEKGSTATDAASSARRRTTAKAGGGVGE